MNSAPTQMKLASSCLACEFVIFRTVSIENVVQKFGIMNALGFEELCKPVPRSSFSYHFSLTNGSTEIRVFVTGYVVTMVTSYNTKMTITCSPMTGHLTDTIIVPSTDKD